MRASWRHARTRDIACQTSPNDLEIHSVMRFDGSAPNKTSVVLLGCHVVGQLQLVVQSTQPSHQGTESAFHHLVAKLLLPRHGRSDSKRASPPTLGGARGTKHTMKHHEAAVWPKSQSKSQNPYQLGGFKVQRRGWPLRSPTEDALATINVEQCQDKAGLTKVRKTLMFKICNRLVRQNFWAKFNL